MLTLALNLHGLGHFFEERTAALLRILEDSAADIIALQEAATPHATLLHILMLIPS